MIAQPDVPADGTVLRVRSLTRHFGGLPALVGLDLDVRDGEILAVIGANGAGKSTLLHLLAGTLAPTGDAEIVFGGRDLVGLPAHHVRRSGIATVRQTPRGFPSLDVLDNVALGAMFGGPGRRVASEARALARDRLELLGLGGLVDVPFARLGAQQRRGVDLARALVGGTRLLLLDEVMVGLTPTEVVASVERIRRVRDELGVSVVWVEHVMGAVATLADRLLVLDAGRAIALGRPDEVLRDPAVVSAYLGAQGQPPC